MIKKSYRFNSNAGEENVLVPLGKHKYDGGIVNIIERNRFGVLVFAAITRYGKSTLIKNWYTKVAQFRPVIVLDYLGEHTMTKYPNFLSGDNNAMCVPKMIEIKNFRFKISQFMNDSDWHSLTYTDRGAMLMADLARKVEAHRNDPKRFWEMLCDIPVGGQFGFNMAFKNKWGFEMPAYNAAVIDSCKALTLNLIRSNFFAEEQDPLYDFGEIALQKKHININFNLGKGSDIGKARAVAGKVLEQLRRVINQKRFIVPPLIVVEEADVLAPETGAEMLIPSSTIQLIDFVIKLQKFNIEIAFVVQDPNRLNKAIVGNKHVFIFGQLPENNPETIVSRQLVWDIDNNYREFILKQTGTPGYQVFIPFDSSTMY